MFRFIIECNNSLRDFGPPGKLIIIIIIIIIGLFIKNLT